MRTDRIGLAFALALGMIAPASAQEKKADAKPAKKPGPIVAIVGADIYPVTKDVIHNGIILVQDGKILKVGQDVAIPEGAVRIDAKGKIITPGYVTVSASNVGIRVAGGGQGGGGGPPAPGGGIGQNNRVADMLNPYDRNILFCLASGITTDCVETSAGGGGRFGRDGGDPIPDDTNVCPCCGMTFLPTEPIGPIPAVAQTERRHAVLRMTYGDMNPMLVSESPFYHLPAGAFVGAMNRHQWRESIKRAKQQVKDEQNANQDEDPSGGFGGGGMGGRAVNADMIKLVEKKIPLRTDAASVEQIRDMIALAKELDYNIVLEGVQEAWLIPEELKKGNVQTILTPRNRRRPTPGKEETTGSSIETPGILEKSKVSFAIAPLGTAVSLDGIPGRDLTSLMLEAAFLVRGGASEQKALEALTMTPAKMLGLDKKIGSIEEGKDADLLIMNGPPLDYRTVIEKAIVGGKVYYDRVRDHIYPDLPNR